MAAGWRDYLGFLPFVRSRIPPAPVQPSVNLMDFSTQDILSLSYERQDVLHMSVDVATSGGSTRTRTSPLRRIL